MTLSQTSRWGVRLLSMCESDKSISLSNTWSYQPSQVTLPLTVSFPPDLLCCCLLVIQGLDLFQRYLPLFFTHPHLNWLVTSFLSLTSLWMGNTVDRAADITSNTLWCDFLYCHWQTAGKSAAGGLSFEGGELSWESWKNCRCILIFPIHKDKPVKEMSGFIAHQRHSTWIASLVASLSEHAARNKDF